MSKVLSGSVARSMRSSLKLVLATVMVLVAAACATPQLQTSVPPRSVGDAFSLGSSPLLEQTSHMQQHLDKEKRILYFQNYGGGGAAVGLLLGPFGVAANMSMIEKATAADVDQLRGKVAVDPLQLFTEQAKQARITLRETAPGRTKLVPYLYVTKTEGERLLVAAALLIEQEGPQKWVGKYMFQLPQTYSVSELSSLNENQREELIAATAEGYRALLSHLQAESAESIAKEQRLTFKSDFVFPRFDVEMIGSLIRRENDVVWVRTVGGVYAVRQKHVSVKLVKS